MNKTENFFLVDMKSGKITTTSEAELEDQDYDMETELPVTVSGSSDTSWLIETCDWYSDGGICRVEVNHFSLEVALRFFGKMVWDFSCGADGKGGPFEAGPPVIKPKTKTPREAFTAFQEELWNTLLAGGKEKLAKLDTTLKVYEAAIEVDGAEKVSFEIMGKDFLSTIGETIDEASAW